MSRKNIGIVDYGAGNINSLKNCLYTLGYKVSSTSFNQDLKNFDALFLPGVGAFPDAMRSLKKNRMDQKLRRFHKSGKPIIGICLGFQLFAKKSYEIKQTLGLGLIDGEIVKLPQNSFHIGWNNVSFKKNADNEIDKRNTFFFNHSYFLKLKSKYVLGSSSIKSIKDFPVFLRKENLAGVQFHPEKSQENGLVFLNNLLKDMLND